MPRLRPEDIFTHDAHRWHKEPGKWRGGCPWHESKSGTSFYLDPSTCLWRCPACQIGGGPVQYLWRLQGGVGSSPRGRDFVEVVRRLCDLAGVPFPERQLSEEERERARLRDVRRALLESVIAICQEHLWSPAGRAARDYLATRGLEEAACRELGLGLYPELAALRSRLLTLGHDGADVEASGAVFGRLVGYVVFPWADDRGAPLTLYGRWPAKDPPAGYPKNMALANPHGEDGRTWERTKRSPLYLDRALRAGHRDVVLVEGVIDAALLQARGDTRVIACVAAELSELQVKTLARCQVRSITIVLDPDGAGDAGILSCVRQLRDAGITPYVAPKLPDGLDPDEFLRRDGLDAWEALVGCRCHGYRHVAQGIVTRHGERQPGDDGWAEDVIAAAAGFAQDLPADRADELARYFWPEIAAATQASVQDLRARVPGHQSAPSEGKVPPGRDGAQADTGGYRFKAISSAAFAAGDYRPKWLVKRMLVAGQPVVIGGPPKSLKTSVAIDLALSLAGGVPFLGKFDVYRPLRVVVLSGESGEFTLRETALRICQARGLDLARLPVSWGFRLPQLANPADLAELEDGLKRCEAELAIIDPLYLSLLAGQSDLQASNLYQMGPLLLGVARACLDSGVTPALVHHTKRSVANPREPLDLGDLAYAGIAEFARQWLLISRREPFDPDAGTSKLWLAAGGSCGQGGLWALDVAEGMLGEDFGGRKWDVSLASATETRDREADASKGRKQAQRERQEREEETSLLLALDRLDPDRQGTGFTKVRNAAGLSSDKANQAAARLADQGLVEELPELAVTIGSGASRKVRGIRRTPEDKR